MIESVATKKGSFWSETVSICGKNAGTDVVEQPVDSRQQVLPCDCAAADDAPVVSLDLVQAQCLEDRENTLKTSVANANKSNFAVEKKLHLTNGFLWQRTR